METLKECKIECLLPEKVRSPPTNLFRRPADVLALAGRLPLPLPPPLPWSDYRIPLVDRWHSPSPTPPHPSRPQHRRAAFRHAAARTAEESGSVRLPPSTSLRSAKMECLHLFFASSASSPPRTPSSSQPTSRPEDSTSPPSPTSSTTTSPDRPTSTSTDQDEPPELARRVSPFSFARRRRSRCRGS